MVPKKDGYTFIGWGTNESDRTPSYKSGEKFSKNNDITLYAIWTKVIEINFDGNGIELNKTKESCTMYNDDESCEITLPISTKDRKSIIGFNDKKDSEVVKYKGNKINVNESKTLYAVSNKESKLSLISPKVDEIIKYTIKYNLNGGTGKISNQIKEKDIDSNLTNIIPKKEGYKFIGWGTSQNDRTPSYKSGAKFKKNSDTRLYAIWSKIIEISFENNGATVSKTKASCTMYNDDKNCTITTANITRDNYLIIGFNENKDATKKTIDINKEIKVDKNKTLYAITSKDVTIMFDENGAKLNKTKESCTMYNDDENCTITTANITRDNYSAIGFNENKDATEKTIDINKKIKVDKNKTLYAITSKDITIKFDENGAKLNKTKASCTMYNNDENCTITTANIIRDNYMIIGFNENKDAIEKTIDINKEIKVDKNKILYAITSKDVTILFDENGAELDKTKASCTMYNDDKNCTVITPNANKDGYKVIGYNEDKNSLIRETGINEKYLVSENKTLYALSFMDDTALNFYNSSATNNGNGLYVYSQTLNEKNPIVYYRGNITNNNVMFNNMCWKIVRTTETGGTKLIYNGEYSESNKCNNTGDNTIIEQYYYNGDGIDENDAFEYSGYMYGKHYNLSYLRLGETAGTYVFGNDVTWDGSKYTIVDTITSLGTSWNVDKDKIATKYHYTCLNDTGVCESVNYIHFFGNIHTAFYIELTEGDTIEDTKEKAFTNVNDSNIKKNIENWYEENLTNYTNYFEDFVLCNDRSFTSGSLASKDSIGITNISDNQTFGAYDRLIRAGSKNVIPSLTCSNSNDVMSVKNGLLKYPIGLLTADEAVLAGASNNRVTKNYLISGATYFLATPAYVHYNLSYNFTVFRGLDIYHVMSDVVYTRPSISLKSSVKPTQGTGTVSDPYIVID